MRHAQSAAEPQSATSGGSSVRCFGIIEKFVVFALALVTTVLVTGLLYRSTLYVSRSYNEGWNAAHAQAFFDGSPLYHSSGELLTNNYPPLSFVLTAVVMHIVPDAVFAGRILASVAFIAIAVLVALILIAVGRDALAGLLGGVIFAACMAVNFPNYVGTDDPQMLAHMFMLTGVYAAVRRGISGRAVALAALLMVIGLFIKHNPVGLPIAFAIWLLRQHRRFGYLFISSVLIFVCLGGIICYTAFGSAFVSSLLAPRQYLISKSWHDLISMPPALSAMLCLGPLVLVLGRGRRAPELLGLYLAASIVAASVTACGAGVSDNALFDLVIAEALSMGYLLALARRDLVERLPSLPVWVVCTAAFGGTFGPGLAAAKDIVLLPRWIEDQRQRGIATQQITHFLAAQDGPVLCETPVFCYWAGKRIELDPFNFKQAFAIGKMTDAKLVEQITSGRYAAISVDAPENQNTLTRAIMAAVHEYYERVPSDAGQQVVYIRQNPPE